MAATMAMMSHHSAHIKSEDRLDTDVKPDMHDHYQLISPTVTASSPRSMSDTPDTSTPGPSHTPFSSSKRQTKKSTLTQQQKNQKRQRATQDQLNLLELEFNKNPTPNAAVRDQLADEINMTERSVQIWFQNRRAKMKNMAKKCIENGEEVRIPDSMRRYLAMQALEAGNPTASAEYLMGGSGAAFDNALLLGSDPAASKVIVYHLTCRSLNIGTWRRVGQSHLDLVVFFAPSKAMITYYIQAESTGFRIEYPFSSIKSITVEDGEGEGEASEQGHLVIELLRPPMFTMDQGSNGFFQCRDFTEDQQASKILTHRLGGHAKSLSQQVLRLTALDSFKERFESDTKPVSSPVVLENRPSSQPNHTVHPHMDAFHSPGFHMGPPPPRGHKRQRSRSVPAMIDFGPRRALGPVAYHQHHHVHHHSTVQNINGGHNHIFAPVPQYAQPTAFQPQPFNPVAQFQMDQAAFNFDFNVPAPSSTNGTTPPSSDFEHGLCPPPFHHDAQSAPIIQAPFATTFLSPVLGSPVHPESTSPAEGMPTGLAPPHPLFRSVSADPRPMQQHSAFYNDFFTINTEAYEIDGRPHSFDEPRMEPTFNWPEDKSALGSLIVDDPLMDPMSNKPLTLPLRLTLPEHNQLQLPLSTPSPEDDYEFSALVRLEPLTPEAHTAS